MVLIVFIKSGLNKIDLFSLLFFQKFKIVRLVSVLIEDPASRITTSPHIENGDVLIQGRLVPHLQTFGRRPGQTKCLHCNVQHYF